MERGASPGSRRPGLPRPLGRRGALLVNLLLLLVSAEIGALLLGRALQRSWKMFAAPAPRESRLVASYAEYLRLRDPRLGWPFPSEYGGRLYDRAGARPSPSFGDPARHRPCVSVYGDSFARASEVSDEEAWSHRLAQRLGCRVANYGVGGYGSDQAYLRFLHRPGDRPEVAILGHMSEDVVRNLTRNRDLLTYAAYYALKPRFVLGADGRLELVPIPVLTEREYRRASGLARPALVLAHESFQPGGPAGATRLAFPYTFAVLRNLRDFRMRAFLHRRPEHAEFYRAGHPLEGLEITSAILRSFAEEARRRGARPLVLLLATAGDLVHRRETGVWTYAPLVAALERSGVEHLDFGPRLLAHVGEAPLERSFRPRGHYTAEVNRLLAEAVRRHMGALEGRRQPVRERLGWRAQGRQEASPAALPGAGAPPRRAWTKRVISARCAAKSSVRSASNSMP